VFTVFEKFDAVVSLSAIAIALAILIYSTFRRIASAIEQNVQCDIS
jgi:hypothetical protein